MTWHVKNWSKFQHYKCRVPPWIKLHRQLLDDPEWFALSGDASKLLASCWLIASEKNGELPSAKVIAFRLRMTEKRVTELISQLNHWLVQDASTVLAERKQDATLELERELEKEKIYCSNEKPFERFWKAYPRRVGKKVAEKALAKALRETSIEEIISALARQSSCWTDPKFIPHPATWLNAGRWADESEGPPALKEFVPDATMPTLEELRSRYADRGPTSGTTAESSGVLPPSKCFQNGAEIGAGLDRNRERGVQSMAGIFSPARLAALRHSDD